MVGQTISHYKILEKLGEGGMGVVYKAEDTKLERIVAIKFFPHHIAANAEERERFKIEAKAAAALNHPNIASIYAIDEVDDEMFIVMEFVDGKELRDLIADNFTKLEKFSKVLEIATQVAEGLKSAHAKGIIHRDIKPSNVMTTESGQVKIMDFGLAKIGGGVSLTRSSTTLGTLAYMSPEQLQGANVDHRTDIWAFGVVLYEMITGRLPFASEYEATLCYSITNDTPEPLARYKTGVSEGLQRIVDKALDKDRETRYQHIDDLLADLKRERKSTAEVVQPISKIKRSKPKLAPVKYASLAFVVILMVAIGLLVFTRKPAKDIQPAHKQMTFLGDASFPAISPDGQFIAYVTGKYGVQQKVMVQDMAGGEPLNVYQASICQDLRWSPDGAELVVLVVKGDSLYEAVLIPRLGGRVRSMSIPSANLPCWSPDDSQIAGTFEGAKWIRITSKNTGERAQLYLHGSFTWLLGTDWSPLGNRLLFLTQDPRRYAIWTIKIDGSQQQKVVEDSLALSSPRWSADGKAIYYLCSEGQTKNLMKVAVAPKSGKAEGPAINVLAGFPFGGYFTLSSDNKRLLYTREIQSSNLWLITLKGEGKKRAFATKQLTTGTSWVTDPAISPDGSRIAFSIGTPPLANLFVMPITGGPMQQLSFFNSYNAGPAWSPDGQEIAFGSTQEGKSRVWRINASGGTPRPFMKSMRSEFTGFSPDLSWAPGANILYQRPGHQNFHLLNPQTEEEKPLLEKPIGWIFLPQYSPDTKSVAVYWNRYDKAGKRMHGIWLVSLKDSSQVFLYRGMIYPIKWSADGKWIYAWDHDKKPKEILNIPIAGGPPQAVVTLPFDDLTMRIDMSSDEKQIVCSAAEYQSDVWLVEDFDPENELANSLEAPAWPEIKQLTFLQNGWTLFRQKKYAEAETAFRHGLELNPKHLALLYNLGSSLNNQRKYVEAEAAFRQGLEIAPEHPDILNGLGYLRAEQGHYAEAETFAKKALARDSSFASYNLMAWVLVAGERDIDRGMTFAQKALDSKPTDWPQTAETYPYFAIPEHTLGRAYLKKGEYEKAVQYLEQAAAFTLERQAIREDLQLARQKLQERTRK